MAAESVAGVLMAMDNPTVCSDVSRSEFAAAGEPTLTAFERGLLAEVARRICDLPASGHPAVWNARRRACQPLLDYLTRRLVDPRVGEMLEVWASAHGWRTPRPAAA